MNFNSINFAIFLVIVFSFYWLFAKNNIKKQNYVLLLASYVFYGWWDWRFLLLIILVTIFNFIFGLKLNSSDYYIKRTIFISSILINLLVLGFFKYFNFFIEGFIDLTSFLGLTINYSPLDVILPVGISFYIFQNISYLNDIYREEILPEDNILSFLVFIAFFPKLVTGPIEKPSNILTQINSQRIFDYSLTVDGLRQILWGLFKKIVIADNCAFFVNEIFGNILFYSGSTLVLGAFLFAFQIYADFSGYSDIAIGTAKLFGIRLIRNFSYPYFTESIAQFWRHWHISFSNWLRDYLFKPLQFKFRDFGKVGNILSLMITFLLCGLWHGSNWTFIFWGGLHGFYMAFSLLTQNIRYKLLGNFNNPSIKIIRIAVTFLLTSLAWIFFKVNTLELGFNYIQRIFTTSLFEIPEVSPKSELVILMILILLFILLEWFNKQKEHVLDFNGSKSLKFWRWVYYYAILLLIFTIGGKPGQFIYIQF
ncbi:MAG: MBOAT family O-acyltransferase [Ignavibacteriaceae bacterium]